MLLLGENTFEMEMENRYSQETYEGISMPERYLTFRVLNDLFMIGIENELV